MADAPLILGFDTSGPYCSAVLLRGDAILADAYEDMAKGQAENLFPLLESVLRDGGVEWSDLDAIGVGIGPGNFTGIRISVSAARGLALSLDIPAVGVSLLEAAALGHDGPVLSCLSAPRNSAYFQGFGTKTDIPAQFLTVDDVPTEWAEPRLTCIGSAADPVTAKLGARVKPATYAPGAAARSRARDPVVTPDTFAALHTRAFTDQRPWSRDEFAALMTDPHVFTAGGARAAALGRVVADEAELLTLATDPDLQRQGLGQAALVAYEAEARLRGAARSFLEVAVTNSGAIALYLAAGYRDAGLRKNYAALRDGRRVDARVMDKTLT